MRFTGAALPLAWLAICFGSCTPLEPGKDSFGSAGSSLGGAGGEAGSAVGGSGGEAHGGAAEGGDAAAPPAGGEGGSPELDRCKPVGERPLKRLAESEPLTLDVDTTWDCSYDYQLVNHVIVGKGATLRITAGVTVTMAPKVMLLVQRGALLEALGTEQEPIDFTSMKEPGTRQPGDYRGLILIGDGPSQSTTTPVHDSLNDSRAHYGGGPAGDPNGSCGKLHYVRIDFAGGSIDDSSHPAGALTLAGCGAGTSIDHVQIHRATDGLGLLGGTVNLRHVLVSNNFLGEAIEWSAGYTGTLQFVVAQSLGASAAMQGSNAEEDTEASPISRPTIYNATLVGSAPLVTGQHFGFVLQLGSRAVLKNSVVQGFADAAFDLRLDQATLSNQVGPGKGVDVSHVLLNANHADYSDKAQVLSSMASMRSQDPGLRAAANPTPTMPRALPAFAPTDPTVNTDPAPVPAGLDATAGFRGGVPQDGPDWTVGWTRFPND